MNFSLACMQLKGDEKKIPLTDNIEGPILTSSSLDPDVGMEAHLAEQIWASLPSECPAEYALVVRRLTKCNGATKRVSNVSFVLKSNQVGLTGCTG